MKYFTAERYLALHRTERADRDAADADCEVAVAAYDVYQTRIRPRLPQTVAELVDGQYLPDAEVLSMGAHENLFVIILQLDVPPHDLANISYKLTAPPRVNRQALPASVCSQRPRWLYDEVALLEDGDSATFEHSIHFSNS